MGLVMDPAKRSLAGLWAQKYVKDLSGYAWEQAQQGEGFQSLAQGILNTLRFASSQAWSQTEALLASDVRRHRMDPTLIDPWQIADDSRQIFELLAQSLQRAETPDAFAVAVTPVCGQIRHRYTHKDPRVLGFVSMQFHYTGQHLLGQMDPDQQPLMVRYLKVADDHLYMPLQQAYDAAADLPLESPALQTLHQLLPLVTRVAEEICEHVAQAKPLYRCHTGSLGDPQVRISSVRDVEMFQVYLGLSLLRGSMDPIQGELFPLCVMLYPPLQVSWSLVREMLSLLEQVWTKYLDPQQRGLLDPYLADLQTMFRPDVVEG